jgi:hypothetical protein
VYGARNATRKCPGLDAQGWVARVLLSAAMIAVAGCSLFEPHDVQTAQITSISAPDTVLADTTFQATITAMLGPDSGYVLDHVQVSSSSDAKLTVQVWSRDTAAVRPATKVAVYYDVEAGAEPTEPGEFTVIGIQPDGKTLRKVITVLP